MSKESEDEIRSELSALKRTIYGNGRLGLSQQTNIMWRFHTWLLCTISAGLGVAVTILIHKFLK